MLRGHASSLTSLPWPHLAIFPIVCPRCSRPRSITSDSSFIPSIPPTTCWMDSSMWVFPFFVYFFSGRLIDILPFLDCINSSFEIERWLISGIHFLLCEIIPLLLPGATLLGILFRKYLDRSNRPPFSDIIHTILSSLVHSSALLFAVLQSALQALCLKLHFGGFFLSVRISTRTRQLDRTYR